MANVGSTAVNQSDLCALVHAWPLCGQDADGYFVLTHCQFPNGSLVKVRIRQAGDHWIVSDNGAALDEALSSGIEAPVFGLNVRRAIRSKGLDFNDGRIESPRIRIESLYNAVIVVANACRDVADTLIMVGGLRDNESLEKQIRRILVHRFHSWVSHGPFYINGASERTHKFDNAVSLPDGRRVLIDVVKHQGNSINSAVVANLDVARLGNPQIVQRIVFDAAEKWKPEEISLLEVGAVPVALSKLGDAVARIAS